MFINFYSSTISQLCCNQFLFIFKEGPAAISVFNRKIRTTSSVEAYNGQLGRIIAKKGHFFKFVECLRTEEFSKSVHMRSLINTGGATKSVNRKKNDVVIHFYSLYFVLPGLRENFLSFLFFS